jgi:hypothetical protein
MASSCSASLRKAKASKATESLTTPQTQLHNEVLGGS